MAKSKQPPERGLGSNQYGDKPPRVLSDGEIQTKRELSEGARNSLYDLALTEENITERLDAYISASPIKMSRYDAVITHPANPYGGSSLKVVEDADMMEEWKSVYSSHVDTVDGPKERKWHPAGEIVVGYDETTPLGEPEFVVIINNISPPKELLRHYGVENHAALNYAESDRVFIDGSGRFEDANSADEPPDVPAIPFVLLPEPAKERIREIVNYHVQFGSVWEATYNESNDTWDVMVKYADRFGKEVWPPQPKVSQVDEFSDDFFAEESPRGVAF
jgi:hypothetical protein